MIASLATPGYRPQLEPLFERTYGYLSGLLSDSGRPGDLVLRMAPLGYRIEAFSGRRARVAGWQGTLLATPTRAPVAAWSTSRAVVVWSAGRWRVARFGRDVAGPVPSFTAPSGGSPPRAFVAAVDAFSPFTP